MILNVHMRNRSIDKSECSIIILLSYTEFQYNSVMTGVIQLFQLQYQSFNHENNAIKIYGVNTKYENNRLNS